MRGVLLLEDGRFFEGPGFGAAATAVGEVVFNTALTGYQEALTDPSYREQIVVMTAAHVGNYGTNDEDAESGALQVAGFCARTFSSMASNHRATRTLQDELARAGVPGLHGLDTRALVRHIRSRGAMRAVISTETADRDALMARVQAWPGMEGRALAAEVSTPARYTFATTPTPLARIHVLDGGVKRNILRLVASVGCHVEVYPARTPAEELADGADAVLLTNGPGDPAAHPEIIAEVRKLLGKLPLLGVCLGQQFLGLALGCDTFKLRFGHRGVNHPVRDLETGRVEITSQNHGFCVDPAGLARAGATITHTNLNDGTLEGFRHDDLRVMCVQFHPEASPGPHDSAHLLMDRYLRFAGILPAAPSRATPPHPRA